MTTVKQKHIRFVLFILTYLALLSGLTSCSKQDSSMMSDNKVLMRVHYRELLNQYAEKRTSIYINGERIHETAFTGSHMFMDSIIVPANVDITLKNQYLCGVSIEILINNQQHYYHPANCDEDYILINTYIND